MEILLDTNFLIYAVKYKIIDDIFEMHPKKLIMPSQVLDELKKISHIGKGKDKESAKIAIVMAEKWKNDGKMALLEHTSKYTDEAILDFSREISVKNKAFYVATQDNVLIKKLKKAKIGIIKIRQKKYLMLD